MDQHVDPVNSLLRKSGITGIDIEKGRDSPLPYASDSYLQIFSSRETA